ncbi:MAG TPA: ABC transporter permease subunit [Candidatus Egerieimonas intestinavium]|uniref:ABC transporter permease subunit n=1 Tax=Candidatus Egerieimonas intestinavium TaxID=2840777 RepID=A0A9D1JEZ3_9FIRM|nr:ABC transporter permease subunit [Candidatus Egerieimonas intestinavium]
MKLNPVFQSEVRRNSRSMRISWIIFGGNLMLAVIVAVSFLGAGSMQGYVSAGQYQIPIRCHMLMCYALFFMECLLIPGIAGSSIAGERERRTLDILLTTNLNPWRIIVGKLEASLSLVFLLAFSALPSMAMVMIFGGVGLTELLTEVLFLVVTGIFIGSIGIFCSAMCKKTNMATILSYLLVVALVVGTVLALMLWHYLLTVRMENSGVYQEVSLGAGIYLLLLNPLAPYFGLISGQLGNGYELQTMASCFGDYGGSWGVRHMVILGILVQLLLSALLLLAAGKKINPLNK